MRLKHLNIESKNFTKLNNLSISSILEIDYLVMYMSIFLLTGNHLVQNLITFKIYYSFQGIKPKSFFHKFRQLNYIHCYIDFVYISYMSIIKKKCDK